MPDRLRSMRPSVVFFLFFPAVQLGAATALICRVAARFEWAEFPGGENHPDYPMI